MRDLLSQTMLAIRQRSLTYFLGALALSAGVAAYLCVAGMAEGAFEHSRKMYEGMLSLPPSIGVSIFPEKYHGDITLDIDETRETLANRLGTEQAAFVGFVADAKVERRFIKGINVRAYSDGAFLPVESRGRYKTRGRLLDQSDQQSHAMVCIINGPLADFAFPGEDPLGQNLRLGGYNFEIVGVEELPGGTLANPSAIIPLSTARDCFPQQPPHRVTFFSWSNASVTEEKLKEMENDLSRELGAAHRVNVYSHHISAQKAFAELRKMRLIVASCACLLLLIGLLGMTEMLLANLSGRIREIGVHRAFGATRGRLAAEILLQAAVTGLAGGVVGVLVGFGIIRLLSAAYPLNFLVTPAWVIIAIAASITASLIAGLIPARAAMRISPIVALRAE